MTANILKGSSQNGHRNSRARPTRMRGIGLVEVLVSVLVLGVGLLGIAAMQSLGLRGGQSSLESSQAVMQTTSIIEAMRANRAATYAMPSMQCALPAAGTLAQNDMRQWIASLKATIGSGVLDTTTCGQITGCPGACVITVQWNDTRAGDSATRSIITSTRI